MGIGKQLDNYVVLNMRQWGSALLACIVDSYDYAAFSTAFGSILLKGLLAT